VQAVITGVSFLGAGTIIWHQRTAHLEGLTTAATLLFTAAIGICVALEQAILAIGLTALVLITLRGIRPLWHLLDRSKEENDRKAGEQE